MISKPKCFILPVSLSHEGISNKTQFQSKVVEGGEGQDRTGHVTLNPPQSAGTIPRGSKGAHFRKQHL